METLAEALYKIYSVLIHIIILRSQHDHYNEVAILKKWPCFTLQLYSHIQPLCSTHLVNDSPISNVQIVVKFVVNEELLSSCLRELDANNKKSFLCQP